MKEVIFRIESNVQIAKNTYEMDLVGDTGDITRPGQFVNIKLEGFFLRRPISVCHYEEGRMTLIYKAVGEGTELMAGLAPGTRLNVLTGLGNGFLHQLGVVEAYAIVRESTDVRRHAFKISQFFALFSHRDGTVRDHVYYSISLYDVQFLFKVFLAVRHRVQVGHRHHVGVSCVGCRL